MKIAVLGLGIIGSAWAQNLIADGNEVRTWNRTPKEFPGFTANVEEAVKDAEAIFIVVADPAAVENVLEKILPVLTHGQTVIQSSTISAEWTTKFAGLVVERGAKFLEAPFTGSKLAAEARKTVFYLGGDDALIQETISVLEPISETRMHIGPLGTASSLKLAMNVNLAGVAQSLCESLALSRSLGISDDTFFKALDVNAGRSGLSDIKRPKLCTSDFAPQFSVKHMAKDLRLSLETAHGQPIPQTKSLLLLYNKAIEHGWADEDMIALIKLLEPDDC